MHTLSEAYNWPITHKHTHTHTLVWYIHTHTHTPSEAHTSHPRGGERVSIDRERERESMWSTRLSIDNKNTRDKRVCHDIHRHPVTEKERKRQTEYLWRIIPEISITSRATSVTHAFVTRVCHVTNASSYLYLYIFQYICLSIWQLSLDLWVTIYLSLYLYIKKYIVTHQQFRSEHYK